MLLRSLCNMGGVPIDYPLMGAFTVVMVIGSCIGTRLAGRISRLG